MPSSADFHAANAVVVAGIDRRVSHSEASPVESYAIAALELKTGKLLWKHSLPAGAVRWGIALDRNGRVLVGLRDGRVVCLARL